MTCSAWNPLNSASATVNVKMVEGIQGISITNRNLVKPNKETTYTMTIASLGVDSCVIVDYGETGGTKEYYGNTAGCASRLPSGSTIKGSIQSTMALKYTYKTKGNYEATVNGYTDVLQATNSSKVTITVSEMNCLSPLITMNPANPRFYEPYNVERSDYVKLIAQNTIDCQETLENLKEWKIYSVNPTTGADVKEIDIKSVATRTTANLVLNPRFLDYGTYRCAYKMSMKTSGETFPVEKSTFVKVNMQVLLGKFGRGGWGNFDAAASFHLAMICSLKWLINCANFSLLNLG